MSIQRRIGIYGLALLAMLAFSALAAGTAQAKEPVWYVKGAELKAGEEKTFVSKNKSGAVKKLAIPSLGIEITCTTEKDEGKIIGGVPGKDILTKKAFTGCTSNICGKVTEPIELKNIPSVLVWKGSSGSAALDKLEGTGTEKLFVTVTTALCGAAKITGEVLGELLPVGTEVVKGELVFPSTAIKEYWTGDEPSRTKHTLATPLKWNTSEATFVEDDEIELTTKEVTGVFCEKKVC